MKDIGTQYEQDDMFKKKARKHQSEYRLKLEANYKDYGNRLDENGAKNGLNFYTEISEIFEKVQERYPYKYSPLYYDMLRSEHIPFNFIIPFAINIENNLAETVFSFLLGRRIKKVQKICVEWWPEPKSDFLNDNTAFDTYMEYLDEHDTIHAVGIEFKYTEREYEYNKKEQELLFDQNSIYWQKADISKLYKPQTQEQLRTKALKQMFRNHLLGETLLFSKKFSYLHSFTSVLLYPSGNTHFKDHTKKYQQLLDLNRYLSFIPLTFEEFISASQKWCVNEKTEKWLQYLKDRYIVLMD